MARRGIKKKKNSYTNGTRIKNKIKKINKHLKLHPTDKDAEKSLTSLK